MTSLFFKMIVGDSLVYFDRHRDIVQVNSHFNDQVFDMYNHSDDDLLMLVKEGKCISQVRRYLEQGKFKDRAKLSTLLSFDKYISSIDSLNLVLDYIPDYLVRDKNDALLDNCCCHNSLELAIKYMKRAKLHDLSKVSLRSMSTALQGDNIEMAKFLVSKGMSFNLIQYQYIVWNMMSMSSLQTIKYFMNDIVNDENMRRECAISCVKHFISDEDLRTYLFSLIDKLSNNELNRILENTCRYQDIKMFKYVLNRYARVEHKIDFEWFFDMSYHIGKKEMCEYLINNYIFSISCQTFNLIKLEDNSLHQKIVKREFTIENKSVTD